MATNSYGFIQKRYTQPHHYEERFGYFGAIYHTNKGEVLMIEARPHFMHRGNNLDARIDHYDVLLKTPQSWAMLRHDIKSQKQAVQYVERLVEKY